MKRHTKLVAAMLIIAMSLALVGCVSATPAAATTGTSSDTPAVTEEGTTTETTEAATEAAPAYDVIDQTFKIAWMGWGDMDYVGGGITAYCKYLDEQMPEIEFVFSDAGLRGSDAMVAEAEALCQSGVDAIIPYLPSAAMADVCKKYGVWLGAGTNLISDQSLLDYLDASGIWLGYCPHGNEESEGAAAAQSMYDLGDRNFVIIATDPGHPAGDARYKGAMDFLKSKPDATILGVFQGTDGAQGLSDLVALYGNKIQAVVKTSTSQLHSLEGAVAVMAAAGVNAHFAVTDVCVTAADFFDAGSLVFINGGDQIDAGVMIVPAINALMGYYEGPVYLYPNYLRQYSSAEVKEFDKWVVGSLPAFTADELRAYLKCYNPDATNASYKEYIESNFTIQSISERHAGMIN